MTTGVQGIYVLGGQRGVLVRLLENLAAAQGAPPDGVPGDVLRPRPTSTQFFNVAELLPNMRNAQAVFDGWPDSSTIRLYETAGSGTMTLAYARIWLYDAVSQKAFPAGTGSDADKGKLNGAVAFGETGSDKIRHAEPLAFTSHFDGVQVELGTFGGTNPTFNVDWFVPFVRR